MRTPDDSPPAEPDGLRLAAPMLADGRLFWQLARASGLDVNSPYSYVLWCRDFAATSVAARDEHGTLRGFVTGYVRPDQRDTYFLWQVAVDDGFRGRRLARRMLDHIGDRIADSGLCYLEATVTPGNTASRALFASFARDRGADLEWTPLFESIHFPQEPGFSQEHGSKGHDPEELVRIGPLAAPGGP